MRLYDMVKALRGKGNYKYLVYKIEDICKLFIR